MKITVENKESTARFVKAQNAKGRAVRDAMLTAGQAVAQKIETQGRADIAAAGRFGKAWTDGFNSKAEAAADGVTITTTMSGPRWKIFQTGGAIKGRPLLWIPLSGSGAPKRSRDYPGQLIRLDRPGRAPLLVDPDAGPKYHGQASVTIPKKFHLIEITQDAARDIGARFRTAFTTKAR